MLNWLKYKLGIKPRPGLLSNQEIWDEFAYSDFDVQPLDPEQVQPASIDLRLDGVWKRYRSDDETSCLIDSSEGVWDNLHEEVHGDRIIIRPGDFVLGSTIETVTLPPHIYGQIAGRSSVGRLGIEVHKTAGVIDPGWHGEITLEITNDMPYPVELHTGQRVCQMTLHRLGKPADPAYGEKRDSKYQDQQGPTPSRIDQDR